MVIPLESMTKNNITMESLSDKDLTLIEDYLNDRLSDSEVEQVRHRMSEDEEFAEEVAWMKSLTQLQGQTKAFEVLDAFREVHRKKRQSGKVVRMLMVGAVAASITVVIFVLFKTDPTLPANNDNIPVAELPTDSASAQNIDTSSALPGVQPQQNKIPETPPVKQTPTRPSTQKKPKPTVQWDQYVVYKNGIQILGDDSALGEARALMDAGKRKEALPLLEKYLNSLTPEEEDFDLRLEAGKIYLKEINDYGKAAGHFKKVAEGDVILRYKMEANFYLACTYLAQGKPDDAKKLLQSVETQNIEPWKTQASSLLDTLQLHFAGELNR